MLDFKLTGWPFGDATSQYDVHTGHLTTVDKFISEATEKGWGYINISGHKFGYGRGEAVNIPSNLGNKMVNKSTANGGWRRMDYFIETM